MERDRYMMLGTGGGFDRVGDNVSTLQREPHAYQQHKGSLSAASLTIASVRSMSAVKVPWLLIVIASDTCHPHGEL